jgi:hypothetical protein
MRMASCSAAVKAAQEFVFVFHMPVFSVSAGRLELQAAGDWVAVSQRRVFIPGGLPAFGPRRPAGRRSAAGCSANFSLAISIRRLPAWAEGEVLPLRSSGFYGGGELSLSVPSWISASRSLVKLRFEPALPAWRAPPR